VCDSNIEKWAMTVNAPWRICFVFRKRDAHNVEIVQGIAYATLAKISCNDIDITLCYQVAAPGDGDCVMRHGPKRQSLNLRIKVEERGLIDRAAKTLGKNRTDFVLDAARRAAEDALLDRTIFTATPKAYAEFLARLDAPPQPNERLRKTMRTKAPWE